MTGQRSPLPEQYIWRTIKVAYDDRIVYPNTHPRQTFGRGVHNVCFLSFQKKLFRHSWPFGIPTENDNVRIPLQL